jgi:hypothetical protein
VKIILSKCLDASKLDNIITLQLVTVYIDLFEVSSCFGNTGMMVYLASLYSLFPSLKSLFSVSCGFPVIDPCLLCCLLISSGEVVPCTDFVGQ